MRISDWSSDVCSSDLLRRNLPSKPIAVLEPAAGGFGAPFGEPAPERVDLFLRIAFDQERDGQVEGFVRAAVQGVEPLSGKVEGDDHDRSFLVRLGGGVVGVDYHAAVVQDTRAIVRSHVCTPVTNAHLVIRPLLSTN